MKTQFLFISLLSSLALCAQNSSDLTIEQIMKGEDFVGSLPTRIGWSDNSQFIYFNWNPDNDTIASKHGVDINTKEIEQLSFDQQKLLTSPGEYTKDHSWKVYEKNGDLFLMSAQTYDIQQITNTLNRESNPQFSGDETAVIYEADNNLFRWDMESGATTQLTDFKKEKPKKSSTSEEEEWLERDQLAMFDILAERKAQGDARNYRSEQVEAERPHQVYLGNKRLRRLSISPDMNHVVYQLESSARSKSTNVPDFVTQSGYTNDLRSRPKVGGPQNTYETWILDLKADTTYQVKIEDIEGIYDKPAYAKEYAEDPEKYKEQDDEPREVIIGQPVFSVDGKAVVNITAQDHKDRWIMLLDLSTGELKLIDRQHDDAWIGGPGVGWFSPGVIGWIDNDHIWYKSEVTGYAHLYSAQVKSGKIKALTKGDFEVLDVKLSRDKKTFYLTTNEVSPHEQHFYHMPVKGGKRTKITTRKGGHEVTISPDEKHLAIRYSYVNKPWELYVMANEAGAEMVQLTQSTTDEFKAYSWRDPEIIYYQASDGVKVPATLYQPEADKRNGAAVIFVHGAGYTQNVHYWWPSYYREYMFHNLLADNGYTVLAADFRASEGYGRDWRTAIYRHMGGRDLEDQVDGAKYLVEEQGIDKDRIGIYGGSYGGFITLMAMFKTPETFKSGAALRSVTDWAHYNHGYTSPILNTPVQDSLAYRRSSPIYFAEGLKGKLLMLHGMIDTNVQFQDVVRLSQRLIELKKENWDLAVFPLEGHGFREASSWTDEYRRIFELFQETLSE